jgi:hypothetical protein
MTQRDVLAWLDTRRPAPPPALRERINQVVATTTPHTPLPTYFATLGRQLLAGVASHPAGGRALALDLLAADAFVTYAFEAQAEADVGGLAGLAERA